MPHDLERCSKPTLLQGLQAQLLQWSCVSTGLASDHHTVLLVTGGSMQPLTEWYAAATSVI